jgi:hypothetical protein
MVKTSVYLPDELKERLSQAAAISGQSEAAIIRSALEQWLASLVSRPTPHWGKIEFSDPDLPYKVDEILADGFGRD